MKEHLQSKNLLISLKNKREFNQLNVYLMRLEHTHASMLKIKDLKVQLDTVAQMEQALEIGLKA